MACWRCSTQLLLDRRSGVSRGGPAQDLGRRTSPLGAQRFEEVERTNLAVPRALFGECDNSPKPRGDQDALPQAVVAGTERWPYFGMHFRHVNAVGVERVQRRRVALLEESGQQVFGADVVMAMVAALLLGDAEHAPCRRIEIGEQMGPSASAGRRERYRGDTI